jgi:hypothetical protein
MNWKRCAKKPSWPNCKVFSWKLAGGTEETCENPSQNSRCSDEIQVRSQGRYHMYLIRIPHYRRKYAPLFNIHFCSLDKEVDLCDHRAVYVFLRFILKRVNRRSWHLLLSLCY